MGDHEVFSVGMRGAKKNEKGPNLLPFINVSSLSDSLAATLKAGAKKLTPKLLNYEPHGHGAIVIAPGGVQLGLWEDASKGEHAAEEKEEKVEDEKKVEKKATRGVKRQAVKPKGKKVAKKARK